MSSVAKAHMHESLAHLFARHDTASLAAAEETEKALLFLQFRWQLFSEKIINNQRKFASISPDSLEFGCPCLLGTAALRLQNILAIKYLLLILNTLEEKVKRRGLNYAASAESTTANTPSERK